MISDWTRRKKMMLNERKTQNMIFNCSKDNQFTTKLKVNNNNLRVVNEFKILETVLTNNLQWERIWT